MKLTELSSFLLLFLCLIYFQIQHFDFQFSFSKSAQSLLLSWPQHITLMRPGLDVPIRLGLLLGISREGATGLSLIYIHICIDYIPDSDKFRPRLTFVRVIRRSVWFTNIEPPVESVLCVEFISKLILYQWSCSWWESNSKSERWIKDNTILWGCRWWDTNSQPQFCELNILFIV